MPLPRHPAAGLARLVAVIALLVAPFALGAAHAEPADIDAAARGVVRVVIIEQNGQTVVPISHGSGFAVTPERVVTNAHVVLQAMDNPGLSVGIVPSDGENAVYARVIAVSRRNDLALLATTAPMQLTPLAISGNPQNDTGSVTAVGYPMNVDRAQGLSIDDIFRAQPPVKSTGFLSGRRPTRDFDSLLHTAPIARGNSGGPLLDTCGRVVGVNSFGAESGSAESEFFFAVSTRELLPFLRDNEITPQVNALPCRSIAELEAAESVRAERERLAAQAKAAEDAQAQSRREAAQRRAVEFDIIAERENGMAITFLLLILALGTAGVAYIHYEREEDRQAAVAGGITLLAILGAVGAWYLRPGFEDIEGRVAEALRREVVAVRKETARAAPKSPNATLICVLDADRSRATGAPIEDFRLEWREDGCANGRSQYAPTNGDWARIIVPDEEAVVSVNHFNPATREYRIERYLLDREAISRLRSARDGIDSLQCGAGPEAAQQFGVMQQGVLALLPASPNDRLVYRCSNAE